MNAKLAEFLARQHDGLVDVSKTAQQCPDDETWSLLEDDLLSPSERESLIEHVSRCPPCRRKASQIMSAWQVPAARPTSLIFRLRPLAYAMAACLVLAVGAYYVWTGVAPTPQTTLARAERDLELGRYQQVRETLDRVLADESLDVDNRAQARSLYEKTYVASAMARLDRQEYLEAQNELEEAMERGYRSPDIKRLRGKALLATAVAMGPGPEDKLTALGFVGILTRRTKSLPTTMPGAETDLAIKLLREAAGQQPGSAARWRELGVALLSIHRYAEAVEAFQRCCWLEPENGSAHNALGLALYAAERYREAVAQFGKAIGLQPDVSAYEFNAALTCEETGQLEEAVGHWKRYLALEPAGAQAHEARKWLAILERGTQK